MATMGALPMRLRLDTVLAFTLGLFLGAVAALVLGAKVTAYALIVLVVIQVIVGSILLWQQSHDR